MPQQTIAVIQALNQELFKLMHEYKATLDRDEIFEIRKAIQLKIREIEKQLDDIIKQDEPVNN